MTGGPVAVLPADLFDQTLGSLDGLLRIHSDTRDDRLADDLYTARMLIHSLRISARHA